MAVISLIKRTLVSKYEKSKAIASTIQLLTPSTQRPVPEAQPIRREIDRRCGRDRRQSNCAILLNLRSPHARRLNSRRDLESENSHSGIDTYV